MTKVTIALIVLLSISTTAFAACNNPLLTTFGTTIVGTPLANPSAITSSYCKSIGASASCCSQASRDAFQTQTNTLLTTLETAAKTKDEFIDDSRTTTIPGIATNIASLNTQLAAVLVKVKAVTTSIDTAGTWTKAGLQAQLEALQRIATYAVGSTITADFTTYQKARATCFSTLLKQQANTWCLACDGDFGTKGVTYDDTTFAFVGLSYGTDVQTRLVTACYPYFSASATISDLLQASSWTATLVDAVTAALKTIADGTGPTYSFTAFNTAFGNLVAAKNTAVTSAAVSIPTSCTSTACTWITTTLIANGKLSNDDATKGGSATSELNATPARLLLEEANRILTTTGSGTWNPTADDSGVTANFPQDPAGVNPSGAMKLMSGLLCLGALFAALVL